MKRLIFVRHGRAEEPSPLISDFERSLTLKGKNVSAQMAAKLKELEIKPCVYFSSPAFRAIETAFIFARVFEFDPEKVIIKNNLYYKVNLNSLADNLRLLENNEETVILFGHNPSFTELADRLSKNGCDFLPKSGIVSLLFKTETWKGIFHDKGRQEFFLKPERKS